MKKEFAPPFSCLAKSRKIDINWLLGMENVYVRLLLTHSRPPYVVLHKGSKQ